MADAEPAGPRRTALSQRIQVRAGEKGREGVGSCSRPSVLLDSDCPDGRARGGRLSLRLRALRVDVRSGGDRAERPLVVSKSVPRLTGRQSMRLTGRQSPRRTGRQSRGSRAVRPHGSRAVSRIDSSWSISSPSWGVPSWPGIDPAIPRAQPARRGECVLRLRPLGRILASGGPRRPDRRLGL